MADGNSNHNLVYPPATAEVGRRRRELAPEINDAFENFSRTVFKAGALPEKVKQLIAVAVAHTTQCPYCIAGHSRPAHQRRTTDQGIMETSWVAAGMRAGSAKRAGSSALAWRGTVGCGRQGPWS